MKQITIKKNNVATNQAQFPTPEELNTWLNSHKEMKTFGENERTQKNLVTPEVAEVTEERQVLITAEVVDADGVVTTPAVYETQTVVVTPFAAAVYEDVIVPAEYTVEIIDVTVQVNMEERVRSLIEKGAAAQDDSNKAINLIQGFNLDRELTVSQINQMLTTFGPILADLKNGRPGYAKGKIQAVAVDGVVVTAEMKALVLHVLERWDVPV